MYKIHGLIPRGPQLSPKFFLSTTQQECRKWALMDGSRPTKKTCSRPKKKSQVSYPRIHTSFLWLVRVLLPQAGPLPVPLLSVSTRRSVRRSGSVLPGQGRPQQVLQLLCTDGHLLWDQPAFEVLHGPGVGSTGKGISGHWRKHTTGVSPLLEGHTEQIMELNYFT